MSEVRCMIVMAAVLLGGCGDASGPSSSGDRAALERDLDRTRQALEESRVALGAAERENAALRQTLEAERSRAGHADRELTGGLAQARDQLARSASVNESLRRRHEQDSRHIRALTAEAQNLRAHLARASAEIQRLRAARYGDPERVADWRRRDAARERELAELRRYNGFLLQERGNLQKWLQDADAARRQSEDALARAEAEAEKTRQARVATEEANTELRRSLAEARREASALDAAREAIEQELATVRAEAERAAAAQRRQAEALEEALARASAPPAPLAPAPERKPGGGSATGTARPPAGDATTTDAALREAEARIARLDAARDYLVEKLEACMQEQQARARSIDGIAALIQSAASTSRSGRMTPAVMTVTPRAGWPPAPATRPRTVPVADEKAEAAKGGRHEKELIQTREKLKNLEKAHASLQAKLADAEKELTSVRKQVETLTWANKELVKELDAYASGKTGPSALPEGTRGIYVLQKGESLSEVAKAFYGNSGRWRDLVEANKEKIPDPDRIEAGTVILIPD